MSSDELYNRFASFLNYKEIPSRENKENNNWIESAGWIDKSCKQRALYIQFNRFFDKPRATRYKIQATS
jgi:hypothetical protein